MDSKAAVQALADGDMFGLTHALEWDECRMVRIEPPESARLMIERLGLNPNQGRIDRLYARRGSTLIRVSRDECHPDMSIHHYESVTECREKFITFNQEVDSITDMARQMGAEVVDSGLMVGALDTVVPDSPAAIGWTPPPSSPW